jgi:lysophospholipase L1-like esterase
VALVLGLVLGAAAAAFSTGAAAPAARSGGSGGGQVPTLRVVGLGDSVPSADTCGCAGYLERLRAGLERLTGRPVTLRNDARAGWTSAQVLADLRGGRGAADVARGADLVVVEVGANDADLSSLTDPSCLPTRASGCFDGVLATLRSTLTDLVGRIRAEDPVAAVRVALLGYWNVGLDGPVGRARGSVYVTASDELTREMNEVVREVAVATRSTYVDAYTPFKGSDGTRDAGPDLLDDGDHPNADGHALLADAVLDRLEAVGAVDAWSG